MDTIQLEFTKTEHQIGSIIWTIIKPRFQTFIWDMVETVASWSIRLPGLIFELSLDGIIWLLTVKLLFWILGGLVSILCFILAIILGLAISIFVYPFALSKNLKHPELED